MSAASNWLKHFRRRLRHHGLLAALRPRTLERRTPQTPPVLQPQRTRKRRQIVGLKQRNPRWFKVLYVVTIVVVTGWLFHLLSRPREAAPVYFEEGEFSGAH